MEKQRVLRISFLLFIVFSLLFCFLQCGHFSGFLGSFHQSSLSVFRLGWAHTHRAQQSLVY
jgi:hypothetical protein